jgi:hypothetical protein
MECQKKISKSRTLAKSCSYGMLVIIVIEEASHLFNI